MPTIWTSDYPNLDDLEGRFVPASSASPASLDFHEDTDNGANRIRITAPAAVASDKTLTLPDETGTVFTNQGGTFAADIIVPDEAYDATAWNGSLEVPTKNAIRDKIESMGGGGLTIGDAVTSGGANRLLYEDGSQNLAASANLTQTSTLALQAITPTGGEGIVIKPTTDYETLFKLKNAAGSTTGLNINLDGNGAPNFTANNNFIVLIDSNVVMSLSGHTNFSTTPTMQVSQVVGTRPALGLTGHMRMTEMTAPSAPAANNVHIYAEDNGSGKTRVMCLFGSGAAQQIAIEP